MVAEERGYAGTANFRMFEQELQTGATVYDVISHPNGSYEQAEVWRALLDPIESLDDHVILREALMENIWNSHGAEDG